MNRLTSHPFVQFAKGFLIGTVFCYGAYKLILELWCWLYGVFIR